MAGPTDAMVLLLTVAALSMAGCRATPEEASAAGQSAPSASAPTEDPADAQFRQAIKTAGLEASGDLAHYSRQTLYEFMDGGAERYLGYTFEALTTGGARRPDGEAFRVELYRFERSADAYGLWSTDANGEHPPVGQRAAYGYGLVQMWQGPYVARVYHEKYRDSTRETVLALGAALVQAIGEEGELPPLLARFPAEGRESDPVFFHLHTALNHLYYLGDANLLGLGAETDAALASYRRGEHRAKLLLVQYPTAEAAGTARQGFVREYLERTPTEHAVLTRLEDGKWAGAAAWNEPAPAADGAVLCIVLDATDRLVASDLIGRQPSGPARAGRRGGSRP